MRTNARAFAVLTAIGVVLIFVALRDVQHELFQPERAGTLSRIVAHGVWRLSRRIAKRYRGWLYRAGPLMLIAIGATWVVLVGLGAALIDMAHLPRDFNVNPSLPPSARDGFATAAYVSIATLTSVGASDITPKTTAMRLLGGAEPIVGLVLITAWITWVLSLYPVIAERRAFEREVHLLRRAEPDAATVVAERPRDSVIDLLRDLTAQIVRVTTQLTQTRISYYFQNERAELSLAANLPYVRQLATAAEHQEHEPLVRQFGARLRMAIDELLREIGEYHLGMRADPDRILDALARDHLREV